MTAWQAPPTDAATPGDASLTPLLAGPFGQVQSFRAVLSPLGSGHTIRIHLSNRYGPAPVTFTAVSVAQRLRGPVIDPATSVPVLFDGLPTVTIGAGRDAVSDGVGFSVAAFDDVAVTLDVAEPGSIPTHHFTARQTSYATLPGVRSGGDAAAFTQTTTLRPYVVGLDVLSDEASAVVAFGDSITDGFQGPASLLPKTRPPSISISVTRTTSSAASTRPAYRSSSPTPESAGTGYVPTGTFPRSARPRASASTPTFWHTVASAPSSGWKASTTSGSPTG